VLPALLTRLTPARARRRPSDLPALQVDLAPRMHAAGINMRHLGLVHSLLKPGGSAARLALVPRRAAARPQRRAEPSQAEPALETAHATLRV
jgi:hypothetical protein